VGVPASGHRETGIRLTRGGSVPCDRPRVIRLHGPRSVLYRSSIAGVSVGAMPGYREGELPEKLEPDDDDPIDEVVDPDHLEARP
jgi:hypothetical protein